VVRLFLASSFAGNDLDFSTLFTNSWSENLGFGWQSLEFSSLGFFGSDGISGFFGGQLFWLEWHSSRFLTDILLGLDGIRGFPGRWLFGLEWHFGIGIRWLEVGRLEWLGFGSRVEIRTSRGLPTQHLEAKTRQTERTDQGAQTDSGSIRHLFLSVQTLEMGLEDS
jgi:hypothetical protein